MKLNNEVLAELIRTVSNNLDNGNTVNALEIVKPLRAHVTPNCHVGRGEEMNGTQEGYRLQLEWYAGQLLTMVDNGQWYGINSWINCTEKFTRPNVV
jgi:hypothetical protein